MKQLLAVLAFVFGSVSSQSAWSADHTRSPWYIGFGFGFSPNPEFTWSDGETFDFKDWSESSTNVVGRFKVGGVVNQNHLLGADIGFVSSAGSDEFADYAVVMSHQMFSYMFYPAGEGFFLRAGIGLGHLTLTAENTAFGDFEGTNNGTAVLFGGGYSWWIGRTFNIAINLDHEVHNYSDTTGDFVDVDKASATQLYVTFDWY